MDNLQNKDTSAESLSEVDDVKYILTNGQHYIHITRTGAIRGVERLARAKTFESEEGATEFSKTLPRRLKNFTPVSVSMQEIRADNRRCAIAPDIRDYVYAKANGRCVLCGKPVKYSDFTIDHIIPISAGGKNEIVNLQCACMECNKIKADALPEDFMQKISDIFLYNVEKRYKHGIRKRIALLILNHYARVLNARCNLPIKTAKNNEYLYF